MAKIVAKLEFDAKTGELQLKKFSKGADEQFGKASKSSDKFAQKFSSGITKAAKAGAAAIAAFTAAGIAATVKFEERLGNVATLLGDRSAIDGYRKQLIELGQQGFGSVSKLADGLYQTISAGVKGASNQMEFLEKAAIAAKVGLASTFEAVDLGTTILNAFGESAGSAEKVFDQVQVTVQQGKTTFAELAASVGEVAPTFAIAKISTEELFASISTLTANGIKTANAATFMKNAVLGIIKPQDSAAAAAKRHGVQLGQAALDARGLSGVLAQVREKVGDNSEALTEIFPNIRAFNAVAVLAGEGSAKFAEDLEAQNNAAGKLADIWEDVQKRADIVFTKFKDQMIATVVEGFTPFVETLSQAVQDGNFDSLITLVGNLASVVTSFLEVLGRFEPVFSVAIGSINLLLDAVDGSLTLFKDIPTIYGEVITYTKDLQTADTELTGQIEELTTAQIELNRSLVFQKSQEILNTIDTLKQKYGELKAGMIAASAAGGEFLNHFLGSDEKLLKLRTQISELEKEYARLFGLIQKGTGELSARANLDFTITTFGEVESIIKSTGDAIDDLGKKTKKVYEGKIIPFQKKVAETMINMSTDMIKSGATFAQVVSIYGEEITKMVEDAQEMGIKVPKQFSDIAAAVWDSKIQADHLAMALKRDAEVAEQISKSMPGDIDKIKESIAGTVVETDNLHQLWDQDIPSAIPKSVEKVNLSFSDLGRGIGALSSLARQLGFDSETTLGKMVDWAGKAYDAFNALRDVIGLVSQVIKWLARDSDSASGSIGALTSAAGSYAESASGAAGATVGWASGLGAFIATAASAIGITYALGQAAGWASGMLNNLLGQNRALVDTGNQFTGGVAAPGGLGGTTDAGFGFDTDEWTWFQNFLKNSGGRPSSFASGGLIAQHGIFEGGEQGPEFVMNNRALRNFGPEFFDNMNKGGSPQGATKDIRITIDTTGGDILTVRTYVDQEQIEEAIDFKVVDEKIAPLLEERGNLVTT